MTARITRCWQCEKDAVRHTHTGDGYEIRYQEDGLDEVIARNATVHLERMDDTYYWLGIDLPDGTHLRVCVGSVNHRSHVQATVEVEPPHRYVGSPDPWPEGERDE